MRPPLRVPSIEFTGSPSFTASSTLYGTSALAPTNLFRNTGSVPYTNVVCVVPSPFWMLYGLMLDVVGVEVASRASRIQPRPIDVVDVHRDLRQEPLVRVEVAEVALVVRPLFVDAMPDRVVPVAVAEAQNRADQQDQRQRDDCDHARAVPGRGVDADGRAPGTRGRRRGELAARRGRIHRGGRVVHRGGLFAHTFIYSSAAEKRIWGER